jgi:plasmid stabilization system protein ParE
MKKLAWTDESLDDLRAIRDFIARDSPTAAISFLGRLVESTERLQQFPYLGSVVVELRREDVREFLVGNYRVIYRLKDDGVRVWAVYHAARLLDDSIIPEGE